jgi:acetyl esterase/lipase
MKRLAVLVIALALLPAVLFAQPRKDERDFSAGGALSREELSGEPVTFELDLPYAGSANPRQRLDLYLPKSRGSDKLPVIVFFHGGGWMQGNKSDGAGRLLPFVRSGHYAGVSAGYRLSSEAPWPAQIHDAKAAIRWVRANGARYGLDTGHIGVWGRSAGGHLALMLGTSGDVPALEGDLGPYPGVSSKVAAVANFFGVSELLAIIGQPSDLDRTRANAPEAMLIGGPLPENREKAKAASPVTYITPHDPPVLTVHGTADSTVPYDQAVRLDAALRKAGVPSYFVTVDGGGHGNFGTAASDRVEAFFDKYLRGKDVAVPTGPLQRPKPARAGRTE